MDKEITYLIELLRGIPEGSVEKAQEKLHFLEAFKRILEITELEKFCHETLEQDIDGLADKIAELETRIDVFNNLRETLDIPSIKELEKKLELEEMYRKETTDLHSKRIEKLENTKKSHKRMIVNIGGKIDEEIPKLKDWIERNQDYSNRNNKEISELKEQQDLDRNTWAKLSNAWVAVNDDVEELKEQFETLSKVEANGFKQNNELINSIRLFNGRIEEVLQTLLTRMEYVCRKYPSPYDAFDKNLSANFYLDLKKKLDGDPFSHITPLTKKEAKEVLKDDEKPSEVCDDWGDFEPPIISQKLSEQVGIGLTMSQTIEITRKKLISEFLEDLDFNDPNLQSIQSLRDKWEKRLEK